MEFIKTLNFRNDRNSPGMISWMIYVVFPYLMVSVVIFVFYLKKKSEILLEQYFLRFLGLFVFICCLFIMTLTYTDELINVVIYNQSDTLCNDISVIARDEIVLKNVNLKPNEEISFLCRCKSPLNNIENDGITMKYSVSNEKFDVILVPPNMPIFSKQVIYSIE